MNAPAHQPLSFGAPPRRAGLGLQVAPLVDIVFLLICFYLLVTQLINNQEDPSVQLPVTVNQVAQPELPAEIIVNLRHDGTIVVNGVGMSMAELRMLLLDHVHAAGPNVGKLHVVIRSDRRQRYGKLLELIRLCRQVGLPRVTHRTMSEDAR